LNDPRAAFVLHPIGFVRSPHQQRSDVPKGFGAKHSAEGTIEILPEFEEGLRDLEGFSHLYVHWIFDRSEGFDLQAQPPTADRPHGIFSTRAPRRPNPLGLTVVELLGRQGTSLRVRGIDMLDGTPVVDLKPYLSNVAEHDLRRGWLAEAEERHADSTGQALAPGATRVGHVHLKVADLERAIDFYTRVVGLELTQRYGAQAAFVSAGGYHHHIGLNTWESQGGSPPAAGTTGLYHVAILFPTRRALAQAVRRVLDAGVPLDGAADHGVSEAIYLRDPDQNGVELYWDKPKDSWPRDREGNLGMFTRRLDLDGLLRLTEP
jgi:catechol 2,3-dioxygenase